MPDLIGYARSSTIDQNPQYQVKQLEQAGCIRIFQENISGAKKDRPQLAAAIDFLRSGDTLCVWKLSRLGRSLKELINTVDALREKGIQIKSLTENIDTTTAAGRMTFHIFAALAEFQREIIIENTKAGLQNGKKGGRPRSLPEKDLEAARALLQDPKVSVAQASRILGLSKATLYRYFPGGKSRL